MAITIDELQIEIQAKSTTAANGVEALASSLVKLQKGGQRQGRRTPENQPCGDTGSYFADIARFRHKIITVSR